MLIAIEILKEVAYLYNPRKYSYTKRLYGKKRYIKKERTMNQKHNKQIIAALITILVTSTLVLNLQVDLSTYQTLNQALRNNLVHMDEFRGIEISDEVLENIMVFCNKSGEDYLKVITINMLLHKYQLKQTDEIVTNLRHYDKFMNHSLFLELYNRYQAIFSDLVYFPIPYKEGEQEYVSFDNSWLSKRTYGGERFHEGTDIMTSNNVRGYFPVISVSDGVVEKMGWLEKGGYRIGIRGNHGAYFYYAHLYSYAPNLKEGDPVTAGQLLGFMGDSGYGEEGTVGQFDVHLHFGIYIDENGEELSVNPYWILKYLENKKLQFAY